MVRGGKDTPPPSSLFTIVSYNLALKLSDSLQRRGYGVLIADESHKLKNGDAQQTKAILPMIAAARHAVLLSGTPTTSRPIELWTQAHALQPKVFAKKKDFSIRFCNGHQGRFGWDEKGAAHVDELHALLAHTMMVRREKSEVLTQLPPKRRQRVDVTLPNEAALSRALQATEAARRADGAPQHSPEFNELHLDTGRAKVEPVMEVVTELLDSGAEKLLLFGHHKEVLSALEARLVKKKVGLVRIDGDTAVDARLARVDIFQKQAGTRVALLSICAASHGLTLTAASLVVFAELSWNASDLVQAEDRVHRISQTNAVLIKYCLGGPVDKIIWETVQRKLNVTSAAISGESRTLDAEEAEAPAAAPLSLGPAAAVGRLLLRPGGGGGASPRVRRRAGPVALGAVASRRARGDARAAERRPLAPPRQVAGGEERRRRRAGGEQARHPLDARRGRRLRRAERAAAAEGEGRRRRAARPRRRREQAGALERGGEAEVGGAARRRRGDGAGLPAVDYLEKSRRRRGRAATACRARRRGALVAVARARRGDAARGASADRPLSAGHGARRPGRLVALARLASLRRGADGRPVRARVPHDGAAARRTAVLHDPCLHARIFDEVPAYRAQHFDPHPDDRPVFAQFAGHDPATVLRAARRVQHAVDAVDLNFGCPQAIARKGRYGAFLLDEPDTMVALVREFANGLDVPVTAKLRLYPDVRASRELCLRLQEAGAAALCVHGRTREQNKQKAGAANWEAIASLVSELDVPLIANGGIGEHADVQKCLDATGAAAVVVGGAAREPRALRRQPRRRRRVPRPGRAGAAYLDAAEEHPPGKGIAIVKGHLFKVVHNGLRQHTALREALLDARDLAAVRDVVDRIADAGWEQPGHSLPGGGFRSECSWYHRHRTAEAVGVQRAAERAERPPPSREEAESAALERRERKARAKRGARRSSGSRSTRGRRRGRRWRHKIFSQESQAADSKWG